MGHVALLLPTKQLCNTAHKILDEQKFSHTATIRHVTDATIFDVAKELTDIDLIITRGGHYFKLHETLDIPIIPITMNAQEMGMMILQAKSLVQKREPVIGVVGFHNAYCDMSHFHELFGVIIRVYPLNYANGSHNAPEATMRAIHEGADVIIGGNHAQVTAREAGVPCLPFQTGEESLRDAFHIADITLYAHDLERRNTSRLQTLIDSLTSSIIELDIAGNILSFNHVAELEFKLNGSYIGKPLSAVNPAFKNSLLDHALIDGEETFGISIHMHKSAWLANIIPVINDGNVVGAIVMCQKTQTLELMENIVRRESYQKSLNPIKLEDLQAIMQDCPHVISRVQSYSTSDAPILITGEEGCEIKEVSQAIHTLSSSSLNNYVSVNCGELRESDQFSFLFGSEDFRGYFLGAHQGTIFLNRVDLLCDAVQRRILRIIREHVVLTATNPAPLPLSVRIIAYIPDPVEALASGRLNHELFYALSPLVISIPPLRDRKNDLQQYFDFFMENNRKKLSRIAVLTADASASVLDYHWPGNIPQLASFCEKILLTMKRRSIDQASILSILKESYPEKPTNIVTEIIPQEAKRILELLEQYQWQRAKTAQALGISTTTLWRKMNQYGIAKNTKV